MTDIYTRLLSEDQPTTCPKCGGRTDWIDENDAQRHVCLICGYEFLVEFETQDRDWWLNTVEAEIKSKYGLERDDWIDAVDELDHEMWLTGDWIDMYATKVDIKPLSEFTEHEIRRATARVAAVGRKPRTYIHVLTHGHKYGDSVYIFESDRIFGDWCNEENPVSDELQQVIDKLAVDYEPMRGETISVEVWNKEESIPEILFDNQN